MNNYASLLSELGISWRPTGNGQAMIRCPLPGHSDKHPSCSISLVTGLWYCFACGVGGNIKQMAKGLGRRIDIKSAPTPVRLPVERKPLPRESVIARRCSDFLTCYPNLRRRLQEERLISLEIIRKFQLSLNDGCVLIPIYDVNEKLVNVKTWNVFGLSCKKKMMPWTSGYGTHPYPGLALQKPALLYLEGEGDVLAAWSAGIPAITLGGACNCIIKYPQIWKGKNLFLCYDRDKAGYAGQQRNYKELRVAGARVAVIDLMQFGGKWGEDFTDVLRRNGKPFAYEIKKTMEGIA